MVRKLLSLLVFLALACAQIPTVHTRVGLEYQAGSPIPLTDSDSRVHSDPKALALEFASLLNPHFQWVIKDLYKTSKNGVTHAYLRQVINGLEVANGDLNINFDRNGQVISYGDSSFMPMGPIKLMEERITASEALKIVATKLCVTFNNDMTVQPGDDLYPFHFVNSGVSLDPVPWRTALIQSDEGRNLSRTHNLIVRTPDHWYDIHVDSHNGEILAKYDWASNSHFDVYAIPNIDPLLGARVNLLDPDVFAKQWGSPLGWNCQDTNKCFTTTVGNNVYAQTNPSGGPSWQNNYRPDGGSSLNFAFAVDFKKQPTDYKDASTTNLFYWNNIMHDVFYAAGFDEVSGNFQENNFGKGGKGVDAVQANSQDGSGYNNANFATPPDGQ
jgi:extracellular elastinolytic metalloproteinase